MDMCGVRYANNLLKNPATKRLSGKTPRFVFCEVPMAFRWVEKRCFARFGELRTILGWFVFEEASTLQCWKSLRDEVKFQIKS